MKKRILIMFVACFVLCTVCCFHRSEQKKPSAEDYQTDQIEEQRQQVLFVLSEQGSLSKVYRIDGDQDIAIDFRIHWTDNGCQLLYYNMLSGQDEQTELRLGESIDITIKYIPVFMIYKVYLGYDGDPLPDEWNETILQKERKEQWQSSFETYEKYVRSRDADKEKAIIQDAFDAADIPLNAEYWYEVFLEATWYNALSFEVLYATIEDKGDGYCLTIMNNDNKIEIFGYSDEFIDLVYYNGKGCYGPLLG